MLFTIGSIIFFTYLLYFLNKPHEEKLKKYEDEINRLEKKIDDYEIDNLASSKKRRKKI